MNNSGNNEGGDSGDGSGDSNPDGSSSDNTEPSSNDNYQSNPPSDTYYLKSNDGILLTESNGENDNVLLHCAGEEESISCEVDKKTIGYVINAKDKSKYIVCKAKANGENDCDAYVPDEGNSCTIGKLNRVGEDYKLCIDDTNSITVKDASYLVDAMAGSIFIHTNNVPKIGQYYVAVNISSGNIILNTKGNFYNIK